MVLLGVFLRAPVISHTPKVASTAPCQRRPKRHNWDMSSKWHQGAPQAKAARGAFLLLGLQASLSIAGIVVVYLADSPGRDCRERCTTVEPALLMALVLTEATLFVAALIGTLALRTNGRAVFLPPILGIACSFVVTIVMGIWRAAFAA